MEIKVRLSNLRTAPRKVRQVVDLVRGKSVMQAQSMLLFTVNKSARSVLKLLNSAVASAKHEFQLDEANLFIAAITVDEGPKLKRWHPMSRGRAYPIIKRSSHIVITITDKNPKMKPDLPAGRQAKAQSVIAKPVVGEVKAKKATKKAVAAKKPINKKA